MVSVIAMGILFRFYVKGHTNTKDIQEHKDPHLLHGVQMMT